jgi:hypothetical protein
MEHIDWTEVDRVAEQRRRDNTPLLWSPSLFDRWDPAQRERVAAFDAECAALEDDDDEDDDDEDDS